MLTNVEKYKITEEIGHGGMATVYRALDTRLDRLVALKVMHPHLQGAKEARARFAREAISVARLKHPGILEIYDYSGEESNISYIATELLTGPTLRRFVDDHPDIPAEIAACFGIDLARALSVAHNQGVIHRDVKPENVMLHENREVKLTDFGIAQLVDAQSMTTTGQVLGSPGHMAPEQVEGKECDVRTDVFSLGTVLYLLATGTLPFDGRNPHQVLKQIVDGRYADPLRVKPSIGSRLSEIIKRCLQIDPDQRFQSAADLETDLVAFVSEIGITSPHSALVDYLEQPEQYAVLLREKTLDFLVQAGESARSRGEVSLSLDYFNRALALDEGNEQVLGALEKISRQARTKKALRLVAMAVASLAIVGLVVFGLLQPESEKERVGKSTSPSVDVASKNSKRHKTIDKLRKPAQSPDRSANSPAVTKKSKGRRKTKAKAYTRISRGATKSDKAVDNTEIARRVVFRPIPANVSIAVDDAEPQAFGPSFREIELSPGVHRFKFIGAHDCCFNQEFEVEIPSTPGTTVVERKLQYRPAGLYVVSRIPANVSVDDGTIVGRVRSVIQVPHRHGMIETHRIVVTAPGYETYTQDVELKAGQVETVNIKLVKSDAVQGE